jgi:hypothetical protein
VLGQENTGSIRQVVHTFDTIVEAADDTRGPDHNPRVKNRESVTYRKRHEGQKDAAEGNWDHRDDTNYNEQILPQLLHGQTGIASTR